MDRFRLFISELKRRRVIRAVVAWGIFSFAVLQVYEPVMHGLHLPEWTLSAVVVALAAGFPATMVLAWVFDVRSGGIERTAPTADGTGAPSPPVGLRGFRLALLLVAVGVAAAAPGLAWHFLGREAQPPAAASEAPPAAKAQPIPSIAVLPFADMSERHDQEYFADGVAEEILNALARLDGLKVIGRTSSFSFKGRNEDLRAIGQKLDVANVLEGSLRRDGDQIRVTAQLIRAADGSHLWSETYERKLSGIFKVQDDIARAVVAALEVRLLSGAPAAPPSTRTTSPEAYRLYLLGRQAGTRDTQAALDESVSALERAVQLDPAYAPAQAWLGYGIYVRANLSVAPQQAAAYMGLAKAERAIALAPDLGDGYVVRGILRTTTTWEWAGAGADFDRALTLSPGDVTAQSSKARLLAALGRLPEALQLAQRALEADPLAAPALRTVGDLQAAGGEARAAEATFRRGLELSPGHARLLRGLGFALLLQGRNEEARALFEHHPLDWMRHLGLALAHHGLGHDAESRRALEALVAEGGASSAYQIAEAHAWRGEPDPALAWLERAAAQSDAGLAYIKYDPLLRGLRSDPRFAGILRRMNLPLD